VENLSKEILRLTGVTKDFYPVPPLSKALAFNFKPGKPTRALDDVSFSLENGKILGILGPNGAGKTTLLKILSGIVLPDKGTVTLKGMSFHSDGDRIRSLIGLSAYQEKSFYWRLTGRQNLEFFGALYGLNRKSLLKRLDELFAIFGVTYAEKRFDTYSAGMKQTISIIRALIHDPEVILLDEPTKSLDYSSSLKLMTFLKDDLCKKNGKTILISTHQMNEAFESADKFIFIDLGKVVASGTVPELRQSIKKENASLGEIFIALTSHSKSDTKCGTGS